MGALLPFPARGLPFMTFEIDTDRLHLRPFRAADADVVTRLCGDWRVIVGLGRLPWPYPPDLAAAWIERHDALRENDEAYPFAITRDGDVIGSIGLHRHGAESLELGYWIGQPFWGAGYATEAARAVCAFGLGTLDEDHLIALHSVHNAASGRILRKCGFHRSGSGWLYSQPLKRRVRTVEYRIDREAASN